VNVTTSRLIIAALFAAASARAQTGIVAGTVFRDSAGHALNNVQVSLTPLGAQTKTNYAGEFRLRGLSAGTYVLLLRHVGFAALTDTIVLKDGEAVDREYILGPVPIALDSVKVAAARPQYRSPLLQEFEERMRANVGGHFIGDSVLRRADGRKIQDLITSSIPGLRLYRTQSGVEYFSSGRSPCVRAFCAATNCPVALFVDGQQVFNPGLPVTGMSNDIPDLNRYSIADYSGIEFYAGGATIPPRYNATGGNCGVLLLWKRDRASP
jgi:hypothetical protein